MIKTFKVRVTERWNSTDQGILDGDDYILKAATAESAITKAQTYYRRLHKRGEIRNLDIDSLTRLVDVDAVVA